MYELRIMAQNMDYSSKESWEQARFIAYVTAQCQSTNKLNISDIAKFRWEEENGSAMTDEDKKNELDKIKKLKAQAKLIAEQASKNI